MTNSNAMILTEHVYAARVKAKEGPIGIMLEFFPKPEALRVAGVPEGTKLPPLRFVLPEELARRFAASIVSQLDGYNPPAGGETLN